MTREAAGLKRAIDLANDIVRQICCCGHTQGEHGALKPKARPGMRWIGFGPCPHRRCGCKVFRQVPLKVVADV